MFLSLTVFVYLSLTSEICAVRISKPEPLVYGFDFAELNFLQRHTAPTRSLEPLIKHAAAFYASRVAFVKI